MDVTLVAPVKGSHGKVTRQKEVLHTNEKHPFLTKEKGFIPVSQLKPRMHVLQADGSYGVVARLTLVPGTQAMYNLTVAQDHTYAVGTEQWIVHNCPMGQTPGDGVPQKPATPNGMSTANFGHHVLKWGNGDQDA